MDEFVALVLDGAGGARRLDREALHHWSPRDGALWIHLDPRGTEGRRWLTEDSGILQGDRDTLLRPVRQTTVDVLDGDGLMLGLCVYSIDLGEVLAVRALSWADRLITVTSASVPALEECASQLQRGRGPKTVPEIIVTALRIGADKDQAAAFELDEQVTELEGSSTRNLAKALEPLRDTWQHGTALRRRLGANRAAIGQLRQRGPAWLLAPHPDLWRDAAATSGDLVDTIDAAMDRLRTLQDFAQNRLASVLNDRLYLLTIVSAIMMPLSFVTGLLGVNVGGIPARDTPWAFAMLCGLLALLAVGEYLLLRRLHWVPSVPPNGPAPLDRASRRSLADGAHN